MEAIQLWTQSDEDCVKRCCEALEHTQLALALLCVEGASKQSVRMVEAKLNRWSRAVHRLKHHGDRSNYDALRRVLVDTAGFVGDCENYYHPDNCRLSHVIQNRSGMPIMLSSIWMSVAKQANVPVVGVGLPGHFIIRIDGTHPFYVDPFGRGRVISRSRCVAMVRHLRNLEWDEKYLDVVAERDIVARVLRNLLMCYQRSGHGQRLYRTAKFSAMLFHDCVEHQWTHARVAESLELETVAIEAYEGIINHFPASSLTSDAIERLNDLTASRALIH